MPRFFSILLMSVWIVTLPSCRTLPVAHETDPRRRSKKRESQLSLSAQREPDELPKLKRH